ncbi:hypothetical protein ABEX78_04445 [Priestia megaterium]
MFRTNGKPRHAFSPGYKWCGPGCSGPGCPVNDVDCCCKYHDLCYEDYGSCHSCDEQFLDCLAPKHTRTV